MSRIERLSSALTRSLTERDSRAIIRHAAEVHQRCDVSEEPSRTLPRLGNCEIVESTPDHLVLRKRDVPSLRLTQTAIVLLALLGTASIAFQWIALDAVNATIALLFITFVAAIYVWLTFRLPTMYTITFDVRTRQATFSFKRTVTLRIPFDGISAVDLQHRPIWARRHGEQDYWSVVLIRKTGRQIVVDDSNAPGGEMRELADTIRSLVCG